MSGLNLVILRDPVPVRDGAVRDEPRVDFDLIRDQIDGQFVSSENLKSLLARRVAGKSRPTAAAFAAFEARASAATMFTTGEELAFRVLPLLQASGWKGHLFSVVHASHSWKWRQAARLFGTNKVGAYFAVSTRQRDVLVKQAGLPANKVEFLHHAVDAQFFDPSRVTSLAGDGYIFACGLENRDYQTLTQAAALMDKPVRVQASGFFPREDAVDQGLPSNMTINRTRLPYADLRAQYGGARFVVVPLHDVPYAAGATGILEAMAMGKAVIAADSCGLTDYTGLDSVIKVPVGDAAKMAAAAEALWRDPQACEQMGRANREWLLRNATVEQYASRIAGRILAG